MKIKLLGIILLGISSLSLSGCEKVEAYKIEIENIKKEKEMEILELNLDEEIILDHYNGGKYSVTFKGANRTEKRNEFASPEVKDVIFIDFEFENYSVNEDILVSEGIDFKVFDENNNILSLYPITEPLKCPVPSSAGNVSRASIALGSKYEVDKINVVVYNQENPVGYLKVDLNNL